jgi:predicted kinase
MAGVPVLVVVGGLPATGKSTVARDTWRGVASDAGAGLLEVELVGTDAVGEVPRACSG